MTTARTISSLTKRIKTEPVDELLKKRLSAYKLPDTDVYDVAGIYESGEFSRDFLATAFGEDTLTSLDKYRTQLDKYTANLKVLEPFKIEGDQYDVNKAFYGGISHNLLKEYFGEDVVNQLTAGMNQDIKVTDVLETPPVEAQDLTPEFETTVLPSLPQELQDAYKNKERYKFLQGEFERGNFDTALVEEYNQMQAPVSDIEFNELVSTWQVEKKQELVENISKVFTGFAEVPEDKRYGAITNYLTSLYTDEGTQTAFRETLLKAGRNPDTEALVKNILPNATDRDIKQLFGENVTPLNELPLGAYKITEQPLQDVVDFANKDFDGFALAVKYEGRTPETVALLNEGYGRTLTEAELNKFFESGPADDFIQGKWVPKPLQDYWDMSMQGIGDILSLTGGVADRFGNDALAKELKLMGAYGQVFSKDVKIAEKYTPQWFAQNMARMAPMMLGLMGVSVITGGAAGGAIAAAGGGPLLQALGSTILSGVTASVGEGMLEAGDAFNESKRRGFTDAEANQVFDKVLQQNVAGLSVSNMAQYGLTFFVPGGRTASFMVKALTYGFDVVSEGAEEAGQLMIQRGALGDVQKFDDEMLQNFVLGAAGGLGFAGIGTVHNTVISRIESKMNPSQYDQLRKRITEFMGQGLSRKEAEMKAFDEFASTKEGEVIVKESVAEVQTEEKAEIVKEAPVIQEVIAEINPASDKVEKLVREIVQPEPEVTGEKQPWQMTREDYLNSQWTDRKKFQEMAKSGKRTSGLYQESLRTTESNLSATHKDLIQQALSEGKPVPQEVLKDYPDLQKQYPQDIKAEKVSFPTAVLNHITDSISTKSGLAARLATFVNQSYSSLMKKTPAELQTLWDTEYPKNRKLAQTNVNEAGRQASNLKTQPTPQPGTAVQEIKTGDTITDGLVNGKVIGQGTYTFGKMKMDGYKIEILSGREKGKTSFISKDDANLIQPTIPQPTSEPVTSTAEPIQEPVSNIPPEYSFKEKEPVTPTRTIQQRIQFKEGKGNFRDKFTKGYHTFQVKMVDDLYHLKRFTDKFTKGGVKLNIEDNPYYLARLLRGVAGKANVFLQEGTFGKKFWKMVNGKARMNFTGESLENILKEVREPQQWMDFATYLTARRSFDLSLRDIETGISQEQAAAEIALYEDKYPNFRDLAERVYKYQDNLLVYGQEMGLLSKDMLEKLRQYGSYVPFYRVFEELESRGYMGKQLANVRNPIKRIKGSERDIINPLESIVKNTYVIINSAERNQVGIMMANLVNKFPDLSDTFERVKTPMARVAQVSAKELGVEVEGLSDAEAEAVVDIFRPSFYTKGDEVTVLVDGKKQYYRVDQDLKDALLNLDREDLGMLGRFLSMPAKWLRAGATLSPDFMFRNPVRDQMTAYAYSNYGFIPGVDFFRGIASLFSKDEYYTLFHASGAEHSMMVSMDREYLRTTFKELVQGKGFINYVKHPLELLQIISAAGEKATRLGEFKAGIKRGATPMQSGYSSRSVTLDFSQAGTTAFALNRIAAFFNANVRGWGRMLSAFKEHPVRTAAKVFLGITLPSILLYLKNRDDDRWKEIPQYQKDLFWIVFIGDNIYRIPKPFELGIIFGSMPERFLEWMDTKDPEMMKDAALQLASSGFPNPIPTATEPIIEWITNYSFFRGRSLVSEGKKGLPPELQYTIYTSEVSKKLGEWLNMSPIKIDNTLSGYTAGLGGYVIDVLDGILKKTGISPDIPLPSPGLPDIPVVKAFVVRNPYGSSGESVEKFYNKLEEYQAGEQYLRKMLEGNNQEEFEKYKAEHPELLFFYEFPSEPDKEGVFYSASARYLRRVSSELSELGKKQTEIYQSTTITPDEKRRLIDEIDQLKTEITSKALNLLEGSTVLQEQVDEKISKLGTVIDDVPVLSLENPDIYSMKNLHTDFSNLLEVVKPGDIEGTEGLDPLAVSFATVRQIEKDISGILNKNIYQIKPDMKEGVTFNDYYTAWKQGLIKDEFLDAIGRRDAELLNQYNQLDKSGKEQFLKDHPEITINPRNEWLKSNPKENALLAVWGQAKILTKEAYTEFQNLIKTLDIPDNGLPEMTLPPAESMNDYFKYLDVVDKRSAGSWEAQLLMIDAPGLREFLGRELPDTPREALELKIKHRDLYDLKDAYSNKDSTSYIDSDKAREDALNKLKADNPDWVDDMRRIDAIEHNGLDYAELWAERGHIIDGDKIGSADKAGTAEAQVWLLDHPDVFQWALDNEILTDDGADWNEPALRITVKWRTQDNEYNAIDSKAINPDTGVSLRDEYLANNPEYRMDRRRREAYQLSFETIPTVPTEDDLQKGRNEFYEAYGISDELQKELDKISLQANEKYLGAISGENIYLGSTYPENGGEGTTYLAERLAHEYAHRMWDNLPHDKKQEFIELYKTNPDVMKWVYKNYGTDASAMEAYATLFAQAPLAVKDGAFDKELYQKFYAGVDVDKLINQTLKGKPDMIGQELIQTFPEEQIENYVSYYELPDKGKRRDRFLIDNPDFANAMHDIVGIDLPDKVPSIQYDDLYDQYQTDFERMEGLGDNKSEFYIEDVKARDKARESLRFKDGKLTDFGKAEIRRNAYGIYVPDEYVDRYVSYYSILAEGIPQNWPRNRSNERLAWYGDDWFLLEHPKFYEDVYLGLLENEPVDFTKIPTRDVFNKYAKYVNLIEGKPREDYRADNRDLEEWLLITNKVTTPIWEKKRRSKLSPGERRREEIDELIERLR